MTKTEHEQKILLEISDALSIEGRASFVDRDEFGFIGFIVCRNTVGAREIIEDTPALCEYRGNSIIITVTHP